MTIRVIDNKTKETIYSITHTGYLGDSHHNRQIIIPRVGDTIHLPKFKHVLKQQYNNKLAKVIDVVYRYDDYTEDECMSTRRYNEHKLWFDIEIDFNLDVILEIKPTTNKDKEYE